MLWVLSVVCAYENYVKQGLYFKKYLLNHNIIMQPQNSICVLCCLFYFFFNKIEENIILSNTQLCLKCTFLQFQFLCYRTRQKKNNSLFVRNVRPAFGASSYIYVKLSTIWKVVQFLGTFKRFNSSSSIPIASSKYSKVGIH